MIIQRLVRVDQQSARYNHESYDALLATKQASCGWCVSRSRYRPAPKPRVVDDAQSRGELRTDCDARNRAISTRTPHEVVGTTTSELGVGTIGRSNATLSVSRQPMWLEVSGWENRPRCAS